MIQGIGLDSEEEYQAALRETRRLWDAELGTPEGNRLEEPVSAIEAYEDEHYPIPKPTLYQMIRYTLQDLYWPRFQRWLARLSHGRRHEL